MDRTTCSAAESVQCRRAPVYFLDAFTGSVQDEGDSVDLLSRGRTLLVQSRRRFASSGGIPEKGSHARRRTTAFIGKRGVLVGARVTCLFRSVDDLIVHRLSCIVQMCGSDVTAVSSAISSRGEALTRGQGVEE